MCSRSAHLNRGRLVHDVSFELRRGEILGFAGLMGAGRTEVARAIFGADAPDSGEILVTGERCTIRNPGRRRPRTGSATSPRTASATGSLLGMDVETNIVLASLRTVHQRFGWVNDRSDPADGRASSSTRCAIKTPSVDPAGAEPLGRQPAEGRHRQMADRATATS